MANLPNDLMEGLKQAVKNGDEELTRRICQKIIDSRTDPMDAIRQAMGPALEEMGAEYVAGKCFIPEMLIASDAFYAGLSVLEPFIRMERTESQVRVVIGVIQGDTHDIGKNLVKIMLEAAGFSVCDLGRDVPAAKFVEQAEAVGAQIIAMSSLMTTAMENMRQVVNLLQEKNIRRKYFVMVGGGPLSKAFADKIGADGYGASASDAVRLARTRYGS